MDPEQHTHKILKKNRLRGLTIPSFKTQLKGTVIKYRGTGIRTNTQNDRILRVQK